MLLALAANSVELSWNAATDNVGGSGVAGHDVYRNGALVGCRDRFLLTGGGTASG
jgi:chitinase